MRHVVRIAVVLCLVTIALAVEKKDVLSERDSKVKKNLASDRWHYASKAFVRVLWEDYKIAHMNPDEEIATRNVLDKMSDAEGYEEYVESFSFAHGPRAKQPFVEVTRSEEGRFFVELEGHSIPAVAKNGCLFFTTGDVVNSATPQFAKKPYCALEMYVILIEEGTVFARSMHPAGRWGELSKMEKKE